MNEYDAPESLEVVQKANLQRIINTQLESFFAAKNPFNAGAALANLYTVLRVIREGDPKFESNWNRIRGGKLMESINSGEVEVAFGDLRSGMDAVVDLLDRNGLGFEALLDDPVERDEATILQEFEELIEAADQNRRGAHA